MAKKTLLEIVQSILNDIDGDEVNSIDDTVESSQVAVIVRDTFDSLISGREWAHTRRLVGFINSGDINKPTHMSIEEDVRKIDFINYNKVLEGETRDRFTELTYKNPDEFLRLSNALDTDDPTVKVVTDYSGVTFSIRTDRHPENYTSFDEVNLVFDGYDSSIENTLSSSKVQSMAYTIPSMVIADTTVPDLPLEAFPYLIEESKSRASIKLRQTQDPKAEQESTKQRRWIANNDWRVNGGLQYESFGRTPVK